MENIGQIEVVLESATLQFCGVFKPRTLIFVEIALVVDDAIFALHRSPVVSPNCPGFTLIATWDFSVRFLPSSRDLQSQRLRFVVWCSRSSGDYRVGEVELPLARLLSTTYPDEEPSFFTEPFQGLQYECEGGTITFGFRYERTPPASGRITVGVPVSTPAAAEWPPRQPPEAIQFWTKVIIAPICSSIGAFLAKSFFQSWITGREAPNPVPMVWGFHPRPGYPSGRPSVPVPSIIFCGFLSLALVLFIKKWGTAHFG